MRNPVRGPVLHEGVLPVLNPPGPPVQPVLPSRTHFTYSRTRTTAESAAAAAGHPWLAGSAVSPATVTVEPGLRPGP
jgi:hypothetical protein